MERVTLRFDSRQAVGWKSVNITRSLNNAAGSFAVAMAYRHAEPFPMRPDAPCVVESNEDRIITGYVDEFEDRADRQAGRGLAISGRSKTADLIDCSALSTSGEWKGQKLSDIVRDLAAPYGVETLVEADAGASIGSGDNIRKHKIEVGESAFESINRLAGLRGYLITDDTLGRLRLIRAGSVASETTLTVGKNVKDATLAISVAGIYSEYRCKGQRAGSDTDFGAAVSEADGSVEIPLLQRRRVLILNPEAEADNTRCKLRATWEAANRLGKAVSLSYSVRGWRQDNGALWEPNLLVRCVDPVRGVDGTFLLHTVTFSKARDTGTTAMLQLQPREAFLAALPPVGPAGPTRGVSAWGFLGGVVVPK